MRGAVEQSGSGSLADAAREVLSKSEKSAKKSPVSAHSPRSACAPRVGLLHRRMSGRQELAQR